MAIRYTAWLLLTCFLILDPAWSQGKIGTEEDLIKAIRTATLPDAPSDKKSFCGLAQDKFIGLLADSRNRIWFRNRQGKLNTGLCWWHSRFERNAVYLTTYAPNLPKPDEKHAKALIQAIIAGDRVVEIPGFSNLHDFTGNHDELLESELSKWELKDIVRFTWLTTLGKRSSLPADELKKHMDSLFQKLENNKIHYVMVADKGIDNHAWLIPYIRKVPDGYDFAVIDSNKSSSPLIYRYRYGQKTIPHFVTPEVWASKGVVKDSIPYLQNEADLDKIEKAVSEYCGKTYIRRGDQSSETIDISKLIQESLVLQSDKQCIGVYPVPNSGPSASTSESQFWESYFDAAEIEENILENTESCSPRPEGEGVEVASTERIPSEIPEQLTQIQKVDRLLRELAENGSDFHYSFSDKLSSCLSSTAKRFLPGVMAALSKIAENSTEDEKFRKGLKKIRHFEIRVIDPADSEEKNYSVVTTHDGLKYTIYATPWQTDLSMADMYPRVTGLLYK